MGNSQEKNDTVTVAELSSHISKSSMEQQESNIQRLQEFQRMASEFMRNSTKIIQKKKAIIIVGKTGTCKSTITELLLYTNLYIKEVNGISQIHGSERIGNLSVSHTQQIYEKQIYQDIYLVDSPGIDDTRGELQDIENSLYIQQAINKTDQVKILYCILFEDTKSKQNELQRVINDLIRLKVTNDSAFLGIIITKVPTKMPLVEENEKMKKHIILRIKEMIQQMDLGMDLRDIIINIFENNITLFNDPQDFDANLILKNNRDKINELMNNLQYTNKIQNMNYLLLSTSTKLYYFQLLDSIIKQIKIILEDIQNRLLKYVIEISNQKYISNRSKSILEEFTLIIPNRLKVKDLCRVIVDINNLFQQHNIQIQLSEQQNEMLNFYSFIVGQILVDYKELQTSINLFPLKFQIMKATMKCQQVIDKMAKDNIILVDEENRQIFQQKSFSNDIIKSTTIFPFSIGGAVFGPIGLLVGFTLGVSLAYTIKYLDNQNRQRQNN